MSGGWEERGETLESLRAALTVERERREEAERKMRGWEQHAAQSDNIVREKVGLAQRALDRAEQVERERDEARERILSLDAGRSEFFNRCSRAEADNAALLEAYQRTWNCVMHDNVVHSPACNASGDALGICTPECPALHVSNLLKAAHPGAALLERMRKQDEDVCRMAEEIEAWKSATGLERGGDPDGVRPDDVAREIERMRALEVALRDLLEHHTRGTVEAINAASRARTLLGDE